MSVDFGIYIRGFKTNINKYLPEFLKIKFLNKFLKVDCLRAS